MIGKSQIAALAHFGARSSLKNYSPPVFVITDSKKILKYLTLITEEDPVDRQKKV